MKRTISLILLLFTLTSCDWVRSTLGMATSKDIERAKLKLIQEEAQRKRKADSIAFIKDSIKYATLLVEKPKKELEKRFYIIAGSFHEDGNVSAMVKTLEKEGYSPETIEFKNGYMLVSIGGFNSFREARKAFNEYEEKELCAYDTWIYDLKQNLHVK